MSNLQAQITELTNLLIALQADDVEGVQISTPQKIPSTTTAIVRNIPAFGRPRLPIMTRSKGGDSEAYKAAAPEREAFMFHDSVDKSVAETMIASKSATPTSDDDGDDDDDDERARSERQSTVAPSDASRTKTGAGRVAAQSPKPILVLTASERGAQEDRIAGAWKMIHETAGTATREDHMYPFAPAPADAGTTTGRVIRNTRLQQEAPEGPSPAPPAPRHYALRPRSDRFQTSFEEYVGESLKPETTSTHGSQSSMDVDADEEASADEEE